MECQFEGCKKEVTWIVGEIYPTNPDVVFSLLVCKEHRPHCLGGHPDHSVTLWNEGHIHFGREIKDPDGNCKVVIHK